MGDLAPIAVVLLGPGRDGKTRGVVEVDVDVPWDVGVPKERRITGGCWGHVGGHITSDVGTVDEPWLGSAGVDAAKGANWIFGIYLKKNFEVRKKFHFTRLWISLFPVLFDCGPFD